MQILRKYVHNCAKCNACYIARLQKCEWHPAWISVMVMPSQANSVDRDRFGSMLQISPQLQPWSNRNWDDTVHKFIGGVSHHFFGFQPRWCRISSIHGSSYQWLVDGAMPSHNISQVCCSGEIIMGWMETHTHISKYSHLTVAKHPRKGPCNPAGVLLLSCPQCSCWWSGWLDAVSTVDAAKLGCFRLFPGNIKTREMLRKEQLFCLAKHVPRSKCSTVSPVANNHTVHQSVFSPDWNFTQPKLCKISCHRLRTAAFEHARLRPNEPTEKAKAGLPADGFTFPLAII